MAVFVTVGELHVALVTSTKASARLVNVDASAALAMPGVVGFLDHSSIPGSNLTGSSKVEEIFASTQVCILLAGLTMIMIIIGNSDSDSDSKNGNNSN